MNWKDQHNIVRDERAESFARLSKAVGSVFLTEYQPEVDLEIESRIKQIKSERDAFVVAARKQKIALKNGWGHAVWCNFQRDIGNGQGRCNCGVADMLTALKKFEG